VGFSFLGAYRAALGSTSFRFFAAQETGAAKEPSPSHPGRGYTPTDRDSRDFEPSPREGLE